MCIQWELGKLTAKEAGNALAELVLTEEVDISHLAEISEMLIEEEE